MLGKGIVLSLRSVRDFLTTLGRRRRRGPRTGMSWDVKADELFVRIDDYVRIHKPYLDEEFTIKMLAEAIGANRSYVSKAVNDRYGHFRHYLNSFRARYALELMRQDRRLILKEVARMSGFRSMGTFVSAFRLEYLITPGEMKEKIQEEEQ